MMHPDIRPNRRNKPRPAWKVERAFLKWVRGRRCAFERLGGCEGPIEAAHAPDPESKGIGTKAADHNAFPACHRHHQMHTIKGWSALGLTKETANALGKQYFNLWPSRHQWESDNGY